MPSQLDTHVSRWLLRAGILFCLALIYTVANAFFERLEKKHDGHVLMEFSLPIPAELMSAHTLSPDSVIEKVYVSGFFSDWSPHNPYYQLAPAGKGIWRKTVKLTPGDNRYKFVLHIRGREQPVWIHDFHNPRSILNSHGSLNSLAEVLDVAFYRSIVNFTLMMALVFIGAFYLMEPMLRWILHRKISFRLKLIISLIFVVLMSNLALLFYHVHSARELVKQGVIDSVHLVHLNLLGEGVDFSQIRQEKARIDSILHRFFWQAIVRVEKQGLSARQITLSDLAIFDPQLQLITLHHRQQNQSLQETRAAQGGFASTEEYFTRGVLAPALTRAQHSGTPRTLFAHPDRHLEEIETAATAISRRFLGFSTFLHPIVVNGEVQGYYGGALQVSLFGGELRRLVLINLLLIAVFIGLTGLLLANLSRLITGHLNDLVEWTKRVTQGEHGAPVIVNTQDEIQQLAESFGDMLHTLEESFQEIEKKNQQLQYEAYVDTLTSLPNRKKMLQDLKKRKVHALVLLNIDAFRGLNDYFGNDTGDQVLITTAERFVSHTTGISCELYRVGSDEFALTLFNIIDKEAVETLVNSLCDHIKDHPFRTQRNEIYISVSAGIALLDGDNNERSPFAKAEMALRHAKTELLRFKIYDDSLDACREFESNMSWTNRLRQAIDEDRILPYFQPIVNNLTGEVEKYECLVRLITESGEVISPYAFLDIAKKARFYPFITQIMLHKSFSRFADSRCDFTLNLSIEDLLDARTYNSIVHQLKRNETLSKRVTFEIVETAEIKNYDVVRQFIRDVKTYGGKVAIDDFGAGYSNFAHILSLHIDYIKIDGSLIKRIDLDSNAQTITQTIVQFSRRMGIDTIAEFVHNEKVYAKAREYGITYSQGFYLGEPQPDFDEPSGKAG